MEMRKELKKVGSVFPMEPNDVDKIPPQFERLKGIYRTVSKFYNDGEWTMKDFKSFRSKLGPRSIEEISYLEGFIVAFLSLSTNQQRELAKQLEKEFQFSILVERQKFTMIDEETQQEKECYRGVERSFEMGDIVTFSNALFSEVIRLVNIDASNLLNEMLRGVSNSESLPILSELLDSNVEGMNEIVETILSDFDIHFANLLKIPEFVSPLRTQRENIPFFIQETIRRRILAIGNENSLSVRRYILDRNDERKTREAKAKMKHEGYRHIH